MTLYCAVAASAARIAATTESGRSEATDGLYADAFLVHERIVGKRRNLGFDRRKDAGNFRLRSLEVLGRKHPQRHGRDTQIGAPVQDIVRLLRAALIDFT